MNYRLGKADLLAWCEPEAAQYDLSLPWQAGGSGWATDGKVILEIEDGSQFREAPSKTISEAGLRGAFEGWNPVANWQPAPQPPKPPFGIYDNGDLCGMDRWWVAGSVCPRCCGHNKPTDYCLKCDDDGWIETHHGIKGVEYAGAFIQTRYAWQAAQLPDVQVAAFGNSHENKRHGLLLKFDGGRGIVLGMDRSIEP